MKGKKLEEICTKDVRERTFHNCILYKYLPTSSIVSDVHTISTHVSFYLLHPPRYTMEGTNIDLLARRSTPSPTAVAAGGNVGMVGMRSRATSRVRMTMSVV